MSEIVIEMHFLSPPGTARAAARFVQTIGVEYAEWDAKLDAYRCRGVWRNAFITGPIARTVETYATDAEALTAAAQAYLGAQEPA